MKPSGSAAKDRTDLQYLVYFVRPMLKCILGVFRMEYSWTWDVEAFQDSRIASSQQSVKQDILFSSIISLTTQEDQ